MIRTRPASALPKLTFMENKSRNWLITKARQWHNYMGIAAALFLIVVGGTGVFLKYKKNIHPALGVGKISAPTHRQENPDHKVVSDPPAVLQASTATQLAVSFAQALEIAGKRWGQEPLEMIQLKNERGRLVYKIKQSEGEELWVDALSGVASDKREFEKRSAAMTGATVGTDWGKLLLDLHTGKIAGEAGKVVMTAAAVLLLFLSFSGVYLWVSPVWRKFQRKRAVVTKELLQPATAQREF